MKEILGINDVGVIQREDGQYLCWDNDNSKWFLSYDVNQANGVLGDKELNFARLMELYRKSHLHDHAQFKLVVKKYMYHRDYEKSCFVETLPINWAVLYNYVEEK